MGYLDDAARWAQQAKDAAAQEARARQLAAQAAAQPWVPDWHRDLVNVLDAHYHDAPLREFVRKPKELLDQFRSGENPNFDICRTVSQGWAVAYKTQVDPGEGLRNHSGALAVSRDGVWLPWSLGLGQERGKIRVERRATAGDASRITGNWDCWVVPLLASILHGGCPRRPRGSWPTPSSTGSRGRPRRAAWDT